MAENGGGRFPNAGKFGQKPGDPRRASGPPMMLTTADGKLEKPGITTPLEMEPSIG